MKNNRPNFENMLTFRMNNNLHSAKNLPFSGIDFLLENNYLIDKLSQQKVGLLTNQRTLTREGETSADALQKKIGNALTCLLTPEHGWNGQIAEGVKITDGFDAHLKLPIFSLYGGMKALEEAKFDSLVIDLQDVGLRCFTYAASCAKLIETLSNQEVIVCDRPNPLGPQSKGPLLDPNYRSFLAYLDVPFQHGQTMGELLSIYKTQVDLTIIACQHDHQPYHYPWFPPSPNLPSWDSVLLYPALVLLEGTNVSEGRGTSLPFMSLGAPGLDSHLLVDFLNTFPGLQAKPLTFTPHSGKLKGKECHGARLFISDVHVFEAFSMGLKMIRFLKENYPLFQWTRMDFEKEGFFIDYLLGTDSFRNELE